jgi:serine/threonine protein kinase
MNQHTIKLKDVFLQVDREQGPEHINVFLVLDYHRTDLKNFVKALDEEASFTQLDLKRMLYSALCSLNFLRAAGVIHRDIKPSNLLVSSSLQVIVADFGFARESKAGFQELIASQGPDAAI